MVAFLLCIHQVFNLLTLCFFYYLLSLDLVWHKDRGMGATIEIKLMSNDLLDYLIIHYIMQTTQKFTFYFFLSFL